MRKDKEKYISIVTYGNFPNGGASANFLQNFARSLNLDKSTNIEVVIPSGFYYGTQRNIIRNGVVNGINYKYLGYKNHPKNYLGKFLDNVISPFLLFFYLLVRYFRNELDTIILYGINIRISSPLIFLKLSLNIKSIVILPEFYEKPKKLIARLKWYNFYIGISYLMKQFDGAIVFSTYLKNIVDTNSKGKAKTFILPNAMDPSVFSLSNVSPFKNSLITIGYTGTPTRKDGATDLIKSFNLLHKKFSKTHLLIIGDITNGNSVLPELKKLANELGVIDNITFTGLVPYSEIPKLLSSCQILALTRPNGVFAEAGFPTKLGEYFACRKPVVVTNVGDIGKYFISGKHVVLVEPENIEDIALGFEKLILSDELQQKLSDNAYIWMNDHLNYRNISKTINNFLKQV